MVRLSGKLTNLHLRTAGPGTHSDGGGLYLQVRQGAAGLTKSWVYRYVVGSKQTWLGLGSYPTISLATAREKAADARRLRNEGGDPLAQKRAVRASLSQEKARPLTFAECASAYIKSHQPSWRSAQYAQQWVRSLATHVDPIIGRRLVTDVDTPLVMRVLEPIWTAKTETAAQLRGRIELILDWATVLGYRTGANPARWRGHLDHLLPSRFKVTPVKHHPALSYRDLPAFMIELRQREAVAARCLEFLILTSCRSAEAQRARRCEIDFAARTWTLPAGRTKANREHRIPLSGAAMAVLGQLSRPGEYIFASPDGSPLCTIAMRMLLLRMGRRDITPHGFRSTFRTWAGEETLFQREIVEAALGHAIGDKTEQAYSRGDALEKRRKLMDAWATFIDREPASATVVPLRATGGS
jgi:integrase